MKADFEYRAATFDVASYWETDHFPLETLAAENLIKSPSAIHSLLNPNRNDPHNPFEGDESAKQLNESVADFLDRRPPKTTPLHFSPWLWVANPYTSRRKKRADIGGFQDVGQELLASYDERRQELESEGKAKITITKILKPDREELEKSLIKAALKHNVTSGKWLLRSMPKTVNDVWFKVVAAVSKGELGSAAKVSTDKGEGEEDVRVISIYTDDFSDKKDVKRVLLKLVELGLVNAKVEAQGVYYKCDAWTHLDIMSGNKYALKASMYSSKDMLREDLNEGGKKPPTNKQPRGVKRRAGFDLGEELDSLHD
jgi:hypothetical protein